MIGLLLVYISDPHPENRVYITAWLQITFLVVGSLAHLTYVITCKPFKDETMNKLEIFNEFMCYSITICYYFMIKIPDFSLDEGVENGLISQLSSTALNSMVKYILLVFSGLNAMILVYQ